MIEEIRAAIKSRVEMTNGIDWEIFYQKVRFQPLLALLGTNSQITNVIRKQY
jgi:hypothetical protein